MTVKLVLFLALMGIASGQRYSPPSVEQVSLDEDMSDNSSSNSTDMEEAIIMNAGIAAAVASGAPLNSTDAIAEAIVFANATSSATEAGIAAAIFSGVPIDETAVIAEAIATAAVENATTDNIVAAIEAVAFFKGAIIPATPATEAFLVRLSPGQICPRKPVTSCSPENLNQRWFSRSGGNCEQFYTCDTQGFKFVGECGRICN